MTTSLTMPFFSIVLPVYNRANDLRRALNSIANQDFSDFEVIVVNDGSSDSPELVVAEFGPKFRIVSQTNSGGGAARNRGILEAKGMYVALLDSDDRYLPGKLSAFAAAVEVHPADLYYSRFIVDRGEGRRWIRPSRGIHAGERVDEYLFVHGGMITSSTIVMRSAEAKRVLFRPGMKKGQDVDLAVRAWREGLTFHFVDGVYTEKDDLTPTGRVSHTSWPEGLEEWINNLKPAITGRAFRAYRAGVLSSEWRATRPFLALRYFLVGVFSGALPLTRSLQLALRSLLGQRTYRVIVDRFISWRS